MIADAQSLEAGSAVAAQVGAVLAASSLALLPVAVFTVQRIFPGRTVIFARWGFSHVIVVGLVGITAMGIASFVLSLSKEETGILPELFGSAAVLVSACATIAWFAHQLDPAGLRCLGLARGRNVRAIAAGIVAYVLTLPGLLGLALVWPWFLQWTGIGFEVPLVDRAMAELPQSDRPIAIALAVLVMPLLEEIVFRVFLQPLLVQNLSDKLGIVVTSIAFAALHGTSAFVPIFGLSLLLGAVMLRTQRLSAVWAIHALHNGLTLAVLFAEGSKEAPLGGLFFFPG